ncbi:hypothetical protein ASPFODRAFT_266384 [Aspergillus luchuensis CBS 106.47]|uniref:Uncharacterized protein n=1 Tax=Aspergillus luchuensis (strain CBS 106.47) TaxID=1137211 RepID=A0A1M3U0M6_ASPLC|nr:hypothetical protein ASPFODRAFT_266384 [Aspergillus luchuensis CBS 106.47]
MTASHSHGGYAALFQWILAPYHPPGLVHGRNGQAWLAPKKVSLPDPEKTPPIQNGWVVAASRENLVKETVIGIYNLRNRREELFEWEVLLMYH